MNGIPYTRTHTLDMKSMDKSVPLFSFFFFFFFFERFFPPNYGNWKTLVFSFLLFFCPNNTHAQRTKITQREEEGGDERGMVCFLHITIQSNIITTLTNTQAYLSHESTKWRHKLKQNHHFLKTPHSNTVNGNNICVVTNGLNFYPVKNDLGLIFTPLNLTPRYPVIFSGTKERCVPFIVQKRGLLDNAKKIVW